MMRKLFLLLLLLPSLSFAGANNGCYAGYICMVGNMQFNLDGTPKQDPLTWQYVPDMATAPSLAYLQSQDQFNPIVPAMKAAGFTLTTVQSYIDAGLLLITFDGPFSQLAGTDVTYAAQTGWYPAGTYSVAWMLANPTALARPNTGSSVAGVAYFADATGTPQAVAFSAPAAPAPPFPFANLVSGLLLSLAAVIAAAPIYIVVSLSLALGFALFKKYAR